MLKKIIGPKEWFAIMRQAVMDAPSGQDNAQKSAGNATNQQSPIHRKAKSGQSRRTCQSPSRLPYTGNAIANMMPRED